uniref:EF-hand domain-containing protein n=1 Tax=Alexandrium monilatum TaxID=311494 RepID=A0A7S4V5X1_9DINO
MARGGTQVGRGELQPPRGEGASCRAQVLKRREAYGAIQAVQDELYAAWEDLGREVSGILEGSATSPAAGLSEGPSAGQPQGQPETEAARRPGAAAPPGLRRQASQGMGAGRADIAAGDSLGSRAKRADPPKRERLLRDVFRACDLDRNQRLDRAEMRRLASCTGFDGGDAEWAKTYLHICRGCGCDPQSGLDFKAVVAVGGGWSLDQLREAKARLDGGSAADCGSSKPTAAAASSAEGPPPVEGPPAKPRTLTIRELLMESSPGTAMRSSTGGGEQTIRRQRQGGGRPKHGSAGIGEQAPTRATPGCDDDSDAGAGAGARAQAWGGRRSPSSKEPEPAWLASLGPLGGSEGGHTCESSEADASARSGAPLDKWEEMQEDIDRVFGESHLELALLASRLLRHTPVR